MPESTEALLRRNGCKGTVAAPRTRLRWGPRGGAVRACHFKPGAQFPPIGVPPGTRRRPRLRKRLRREQVGDEIEQAREGKPDDVEVVALDARDEHGADALDGVAARTALPLARGDVEVQQRGGGGPEVDAGGLDRGVGQAAVAREGDRADHVVRPAGQAGDVLTRLSGVARLAEDVAVDG